MKPQPDLATQTLIGEPSMWFRKSPIKILDDQDPRRAINRLYLRCRRDKEFSQLTRAEQTLALLWRLEAEVNNGTIHQFLSNSTGDLFGHTLHALREIGAHPAALQLEAVASWFPDNKPACDRGLRNAQLAELEATLGDFERRIRMVSNELISAWPQMHQALVAYLKTHAAEIA